MNGPTLAAVSLSVVAGYGIGVHLLGRWVGRAAREQTTPVALTEAESERLWAELLNPPAPAQSVPRQYHPVGPPLDVDALIASLEPCGSGVLATCRLHDEETCRVVAPCCPTCPSAA